MAHLSHLSTYDDQDAHRAVCATHIIGSINASGTVTRVVVTSSIAAVISEMDLQELVRRPVCNEDRWPDETNPKRRPERGQGYSMGKVLAERLFCEAAAAQPRWLDSPWPAARATTWGPSCRRTSRTSGPWQKLVAGMLRGDVHRRPAVYRPWMPVDVRDDAACHIGLLESAAVKNGERYIAWSGRDAAPVEDRSTPTSGACCPSWVMTRAPVVDQQPERIREREAEMRAIWAGCDLRNERIRNVLGVNFRPWDESLRDCVESLIAVAGVQPRRRAG